MHNLLLIPYGYDVHAYYTYYILRCYHSSFLERWPYCVPATLAPLKSAPILQKLALYSHVFRVVHVLDSQGIKKFCTLYYAYIVGVYLTWQVPLHPSVDSNFINIAHILLFYPKVLIAYHIFFLPCNPHLFWRKHKPLIAVWNVFKCY